MEESREGEIRSQQRITMDNQHSVQPQPFLKISLQIKISAKKLRQFSREQREQGACDFWVLVTDSELCKHPLVKHEPVLLLLPP